MSFSCTRQMFVGRKVSFSLSTFSPFYWFYWFYWFLTAVLFPRVVKKLTQLDSHLTVYTQWLLWAGFPAFFAESCNILREEMGNWLSLQLTVIINQYVINKALIKGELTISQRRNTLLQVFNLRKSSQIFIDELFCCIRVELMHL